MSETVMYAHLLTTRLGRELCTCCWSGCDCGCAHDCPLRHPDFDRALHGQQTIEGTDR